MTRLETRSTARKETLEVISTRGIRAATQAAIDICEDPNAPAPARATASGLLFRAAALGGFGKNEEEGLETKELHMMTADEMFSELARIRQEIADRSVAREDAEESEETSVLD